MRVPLPRASLVTCLACLRADGLPCPVLGHQAKEDSQPLGRSRRALQRNREGWALGTCISKDS